MMAMVAMASAVAAPQAADPGTAVETDWVLRTLARPAPMRTSFVEFRDSPLLKAPLRLSGDYQRPDADTFVRAVRTPYVETTTIATDRSGGATATIARAGRSARTYPLTRIPELAALQASFGALLSGDGATLQRFYRVSSAGTRQQWTLTLTPRTDALVAKLRDIRLYGRGAELRCIETTPAKGTAAQRTLLASAARDAGDVMDAKRLSALCRG